jgi:hypothetical protein
MAQFTGFYSGLKEGRETSASILAQQEATNLQAMQRRQMEQKMTDDAKTKALLSQAYSANTQTRLNDSYENYIKQTAAQTEAVAKQVLGVNPEVGMELLKQSQNERKSAFLAANDSLEIKKKQMELAGTISSQVTDQQTLDEARIQLSKVGVNLPERYQTWSPETKEWLGRRSLASDTYLKSLELNQKSQKIQIDAEEARSKQEDRLAKQASAIRKEQLARDKIEIGRKQYKPSKDETKMVRSEIKLLADVDERFDSLDSTEQDAAGKDVRYLKSAYMSEDRTLSEDVALQRARRTVLGRITPDGKYPVVGATISNSSNVVPAPAQALKMLESNPNLKEQFKAKYGYLPEGY